MKGNIMLKRLKVQDTRDIIYNKKNHMKSTLKDIVKK